MAALAHHRAHRRDHAANAVAAVRMVVAIVDGSPSTDNAKVLLAGGGSIWLTNVIAFGLWYWALDRGGPAARAVNILK